MQPIILQEHTCEEIARIIFDKFELHQSCKVEGVETIADAKGVKRVYERGRLVLDILEQLDRTHNFSSGRRKASRPVDSIGGPIAHKIFKYKRTIANEQIRFTIWRMQ